MSQTIWGRAYCEKPLNRIARAIITYRIESQAAERNGGTERGERGKSKEVWPGLKQLRVPAHRFPAKHTHRALG